MARKTDKQVAIIYKAREVFLEKGFFNTVMDDIADAVGITRRTLYRHFETKEEIAFETMMLIIKEWNTYCYGVYLELEGSGIQQFDRFLNKLVDYMASKSEVMRYLGEFDLFFKDEAAHGTLGGGDDHFNKTMAEPDNLLNKIIKLGIVDGSIRSDIDVDLMEATISNVLWSFGQRIGIRGDSIERETGKLGLELIRHQVAIYIIALSR